MRPLINEIPIATEEEAANVIFAKIGRNFRIPILRASVLPIGKIDETWCRTETIELADGRLAKLPREVETQAVRHVLGYLGIGEETPAANRDTAAILGRRNHWVTDRVKITSGDGWLQNNALVEVKRHIVASSVVTTHFSLVVPPQISLI